MYPRWRYKKDDARIIFDEEQELRLGGEWFDTPTELAASQIRPKVITKKVKKS